VAPVQCGAGFYYPVVEKRDQGTGYRRGGPRTGADGPSPEREHLHLHGLLPRQLRSQRKPFLGRPSSSRAVGAGSWAASPWAWWTGWGSPSSPRPRPGGWPLSPGMPFLCLHEQLLYGYRD